MPEPDVTVTVPGKRPIRKAAWHGTKLGAIVALCLWLPIAIVGLVMSFVDPTYRSEWATPIAVASNLLGMLGGLLLMMLYGALIGTFVMSIGALARSVWSRRPDANEVRHSG